MHMLSWIKMAKRKLAFPFLIAIVCLGTLLFIAVIVTSSSNSIFSEESNLEFLRYSRVRDWDAKRGRHPPCMGQTSQLPEPAYTGNKP